LQLAVNLGWSVAFFGLRDPGLAVAVILVLDLLVVATVLMFRRIDGLAAMLLVPYLAWIAFATALNIAIWRLN
jgi:tryptophan-rich sensory protein